MTDELEVVEPDAPDDHSPAVSEPGKLMRIALMLREMQEEVRRADMDAAGRDRLRIVHERALGQLKSALNAELTEELDTLTLPFDESTPTESEIRVAQAQLIGWLEGLFQGIQAAIMTQQHVARQQLEQLRGRELPPGPAPGGPPGEPGDGVPPRGGSPGQYL
jgi:hypothetical protein